MIKIRIKNTNIVDEDVDIKKLFELTDTSMSYYPVNTWKIARKLGFEVFETEFLDNDISGIIFVQDKIPEYLKDKIKSNKAIILNRFENIENKSFIIAREIAYFFHLENSKTYFRIYRHKTLWKSEKENKINDFAIRIIMPSWIFKKLTNEFCLKKDEERLINYLSLAFMTTKKMVFERYKSLK